MNTLGEMKTLIELQLLQGMTRSNTDSPIPKSDANFSQVLEQTLLNTAMGNRENAGSLNILGAISQLGVNNLPSTVTKSVVSKVNHPKTDANIDTNLDGIIQQAADTFNLSTKLIKSVIKHESNFNAVAVSSAGATGLMQLMPATARGLGVRNIADPLENVMAGSKYLRQMLDKYKGDLSLALAAYNAGPGNVDKYKGIPPFKETQNYVRKITDTYYS
ncbi:lytic transglycosylase domain-containing protein [Bacillus sp. SD088]|uniref:lytic transglycosylase domain-containing protein n=1 Tax=Bacillus sp. SD088 TaxID=2782012 RepID=UPI001A962771|nr:lytic transglycosylase domain-containing protein [Bacillus sp. SD088]MBO0993677.1 lytic transglycosylase domain-containing protein [Bacillus sp. SD088]